MGIQCSKILWRVLKILKICCQVGAMSFESGTFSLWRGRYVISDNCNQQNVGEGLWTGTQMTAFKMLWSNYNENICEKMHYSWSWSFWHMMSCIPGCHLVQLRRGIQSWLKIPSFYMVMLQCTKQTLLKGVLEHLGWEVLQHLPYLHIFPNSVHVTMIPKQKQTLSGKWFAERTF